MENRLSRSVPLFKEKGLEKLQNSHVLVFGLGGVGCYVVEALARGGVGEITVVDSDTYSVSNLNRQLYATTKTLGRKKTEVALERIKEISSDIKVNLIDGFILENNDLGIDFSKYSYVVDAIDTVSGKLKIIKLAKLNNVPVISSMGTGNKTDPTLFKISDISKTSVCPLCKVMRKLLKDNQISNVKVVYSEEQPKTQGENRTPASTSFVPGVAGLIIAGKVINDIVEN